MNATMAARQEAASFFVIALPHPVQWIVRVLLSPNMPAQYCGMIA
jgi:hypothetical protein